MKKTSIILAAFLLFFGSEAFAFKAFSNAKNVCGTCTQEKADEIEFKAGGTLRAIVVGENPSAYIVYRYSEVRSIPRTEIKNIKWASGSKPSELASTDTVLLKNGVAFAGRIIANKTKPAVIQIKSAFNGFTYSIFKSQVEEAYQGGTKI